MDRTLRWAIPVLFLWLATWIFLSWAGIQDDALIHLRYADNLHKTGQITYDGVHADFGTSSLLYVYLLSFLRPLTPSPNLPRIVSTLAHCMLLGGILLLFFQSPFRGSPQVRPLVLTWTILLVSPSAVRWLDDGMETGLALCLVCLICWVTFRQSADLEISYVRYIACVLLGLLSVLLRIELILLCVLAFAILAWQGAFGSRRAVRQNQRLMAVSSGSHLLLGGILALALVHGKMHFLLPDTALAKSSGTPYWAVTSYVTAKVLAGALSFGAGMCLFWLLTILLLLLSRRFDIPAFAANLVFPILFALAAQRGQEVQGARYFVWAFCFSILWNLLQLAGTPSPSARQTSSRIAAYLFLALVLLELPYESAAVYPMLKSRSLLLGQFESDHLERFAGKRGVAVDVGMIGYFSQANICDLAGLVNGRVKAQETQRQRTIECAAANPDFLFFDRATIEDARPYLPPGEWQVCEQYDFRTVMSSNPHYLLVPRATAPEVCRQVSNSAPSDVFRSQPTN